MDVDTNIHGVLWNCGCTSGTRGFTRMDYENCIQDTYINQAMAALLDRYSFLRSFLQEALRFVEINYFCTDVAL